MSKIVVTSNFLQDLVIERLMPYVSGVSVREFSRLLPEHNIGEQPKKVVTIIFLIIMMNIMSMMKIIMTKKNIRQIKYKIP